MTPTEQKHRATAAYAIGHAMEAAASHGVPDQIIASEIWRIALALTAASHGTDNLPDVLEQCAADLRAATDNPEPTN